MTVNFESVVNYIESTYNGVDPFIDDPNDHFLPKFDAIKQMHAGNLVDMTSAFLKMEIHAYRFIGGKSNWFPSLETFLMFRARTNQVYVESFKSTRFPLPPTFDNHFQFVKFRNYLEESRH